jgi:hypothetical protein
MLPKTWQELLDALTIQYGKTGIVNRMSSQEDLIFLYLNEKVYRYGKLTAYWSKM